MKIKRHLELFSKNSTSDTRELNALRARVLFILWATYTEKYGNASIICQPKSRLACFVWFYFFILFPFQSILACCRPLCCAARFPRISIQGARDCRPDNHTSRTRRLHRTRIHLVRRGRTFRTHQFARFRTLRSQRSRMLRHLHYTFFQPGTTLLMGNCPLHRACTTHKARRLSVGDMLELNFLRRASPKK